MNKKELKNRYLADLDLLQQQYDTARAEAYERYQEALND